MPSDDLSAFERLTFGKAAKRHPLLGRIIPAHQRLDQHLSAAIEYFGAKPMPELGGKSLALDLRSALAGVKQQLAELKSDAAGAVTELVAEIANGNEAVKRIRDETAQVKAAFTEILGNEHSTQD